jgi:hypothetical protein
MVNRGEPPEGAGAPCLWPAFADSVSPVKQSLCECIGPVIKLEGLWFRGVGGMVGHMMR